MTLDLRSLAAFRIAIGTVLSADALLRTRDFGLMFGTDGMFPPDVLRRHFGDAWSWSLGLLLDADWWNASVLALEGIAGASLALGFHTRLATCTAWIAVVSVVQRTLPASNAGDPLLACLLFWGMFLPLGAVWSVDAARRRDGDALPEPASRLASSALLLQIAAVYFSAGLAKFNDTWLSGDAVSYALSVHDHGSYLGSRLAGFTPFTRLVTWSVVATEILAPCLLLAAPRPRVRTAVAGFFLVFHAAVAVLMSVGLFAYVGMAAWLAILPGEFWDGARANAVQGPRPAKRTAANVACAAALGIAAIAFLHANTAWRERPLPAPLQAAVRLLCLEQDWAMFGDVPRQQQWVYGRAELADGRVVDLLRGGRPLEPVLPTGGFLSLPHHRWPKIFWELPKPTERIFSPGIAAALARDWNRRHPAGEQVRFLEIRFGRMTSDPVPGTLHELLLATWPPRNASGRGSLDRWLDERGGESNAAPVE
jgi:hypothetical protein